MLRKEFSNHLKRYYWSKPVFWSCRYCILTVGGAPLPVFKQYFEQQGKPE
ncbi:MAG: transposase [Pseudomonadota bacterium]|nr:transposase [Pseudomonadota bacterium]